MKAQDIDFPYYSSFLMLLPTLFALHKKQYCHALEIGFLLFISILNHGLYFNNHVLIVYIDRLHATYVTVFYTVNSFHQVITGGNTASTPYFVCAGSAGCMAIALFAMAKWMDNSVFHVLMHVAGNIGILSGLSGFEAIALIDA
jgi:hypothetical protein